MPDLTAAHYLLLEISQERANGDGVADVGLLHPLELQAVRETEREDRRWSATAEVLTTAQDCLQYCGERSATGKRLPAECSFLTRASSHTHTHLLLILDRLRSDHWRGRFHQTQAPGRPRGQRNSRRSPLRTCRLLQLGGLFGAGALAAWTWESTALVGEYDSSP